MTGPPGPLGPSAAPPPRHVPLVESPSPSEPAGSRGSEPVGPAQAIAGAVLAVAGVCLVIGALLLLGDDGPQGGPTVAGPPGVTATEQTVAGPTTPAATPVEVVPLPAAPVLPVTVLNNSRITGLAGRAAKRFNAGRWPTPVVGNYSGRIASTTAYFGPGQEASARHFAEQFGIGRVAPRFAGLPGSGLTVVLTRDYS